ncbi:MAG TPA: type II secretion system F family protein [Candidatus Bathyarchaeia archaeon]|nr:type II secretion system F family protein [Candidatus Bathyarchaeia archaeon]
MGVFSSKLSTAALVVMSRQLATSYSAGIPILRSLELVGQHLPRGQGREVLAAMHDDIQNGSTLGKAANRQAAALPRLFIELVASGEVGGKLDVILRDLADYYEDRLAMRRMIVRIMSYPMLQLAAAWFLGTFALQAISQVGKAFDLGAFIRSYLRFQAGAALIAGTLVLLAVALSRAGVFKWIWGYVATYMWPIASVTKKFAMARFFRSLSLLLGAGMPITRAVESSAAVTTNPYIQRDLLSAVPRIMDGQTLVAAFAPCKYLTPQTREMMVVGEESGNLEAMLRKASDYELQEANQAVNIATRVGEVVIILGVGAVVGYIVITFYMKYLGQFNELL